tara:strand:- start:16662 stop:19373 length:2712 start_codon:yes stop_codon:yes gene_type:complete
MISSAFYAQNEGAYWYFGNQAALNFNSGSPVPVSNAKLTTLEGSATISDRNGNLLFYTDGMMVYDRNHNIMPNGAGLKGNLSSSQSAIIVPKPENPTIFYIITVDKPDYTDPPGDPIEGVNFSVVDMTLNSGFGDIDPNQKNIHLITYDQSDAQEREFKSSEKISAVIHGDCSSYWVATQFTNKFYAFKISSSGLDTTPVISQVPTSIPPTKDDPLANKTGIGYMKFSTDGTKLAIAHASTILGGGPRSGSRKNGKVLLYDFDDLTGKFSQELTILSNSYPYGVEFSPKGTKLYVTANIYDNNDALQRGELYQYDLSATNVGSSQVILNSGDSSGGALQLAIDGKIYRAGHPSGVSDYHFLSVINKPEEKGTSANFRANVVDVSPGIVEMGLPQFIQSLLKSDFDYEYTCLGDSTHFFPLGEEKYDTVKWDFGDGSTSNQADAAHTYSQTGTYTVTFTRYINNLMQDPACKQINIVDNPKVLDKYVLYQCDRYDENSTDGLADFNLQLSKDEVSLGDGSTQIYFYESLGEAGADLENQNSLNIIFRNQSQNQEIYAKVVKFNSLCYNISEITLKTKDGLNLSPQPAKGCDTGNGKADFNFEVIAQNIRNELGLPADIELTFHLNEEQASVGLNPLPLQYSSRERTIFINALSDNICYGSGNMKLEISTFPEVQEITKLSFCEINFPITIGPETNFDPSIYDFQWNTGEISQQIQVYGDGDYELIITDKTLGCGITTNFNILRLQSPEILNIAMDSNGALSDLTVEFSSESVPMFAIDNIEGPYQDSPIFKDIPSGQHTIFVKNEDGCEIKQQDILVFGYPYFFTPNNDGYNDRWKPFKVIDPELQVTGVYIYDRYGKLLKQLDPNDAGWDGSFNNKDMPSADYWFKIFLVNGKEFGSHFSLIR